ncbi:MAG: hypothetical protein ACRD3M_01830 [Thermoanaerobaculia bacterium]
MAYERVITVRWGRPLGGLTLSVTIRGIPYKREVAPGDLVSLHEAATILKKDFSTMFRWVQAKKITAVRTRRGAVMIPFSEIIRLRAVAGGRNWEPAS